jgi:hypothetical protein
VDIYNLFNDRTITEVNTSFVPDAKPEDQPFGQVISRQDQRYIDIFARGEF